MDKIEFIVSADTDIDRALELQKLYIRWKENPQPLVESLSAKKVTVRVIITNPKMETSVEHSVGYACGELRDGIVAAGGTIWDGTHVQIMMDEEK